VSVTPLRDTGRKKSRWRTVWVTTKARYSAREATAAKASWVGVNSGPGSPSVTVGSTRQTVANVATVASAPPVPSALNRTVPNRRDPSSSDNPRMPFTVIMTAAKTCLARQGGRLVPAREHERDDEGDLDDRDRDGEHE
jgi:hypothetical protein